VLGAARAASGGRSERTVTTRLPSHVRLRWVATQARLIRRMQVRVFPIHAPASQARLEAVVHRR
jgi:hypothetical protein